jgi:hypothetical protein
LRKTDVATIAALPKHGSGVTEANFAPKNGHIETVAFAMLRHFSKHGERKV